MIIVEPKTIQVLPVRFRFPPSDQVGVRTDEQTLHFEKGVSHVVAVVQGYEGHYETPAKKYWEIGKVHAKVSATVQDAGDRRATATCEWQFGPEIPGYPSAGDVWAVVIGF